MKTAASTLTVLAMLLSSATAWASVGNCSAMMRGHECCCHHRAEAGISPHGQLGAEPMRCCDMVGACTSPTQAPASSTVVQIDAPVALPVPPAPQPAVAPVQVGPFPERSRGPPSSARSLYVHNCSWLI